MVVMISRVFAQAPLNPPPRNMSSRAACCQVMEENINPDNVEVASVTGKGYSVYTPEQLTEVLQRL